MTWVVRLRKNMIVLPCFKTMARHSFRSSARHLPRLAQHQTRFLNALRTQALITGSSLTVGAIVGAAVGAETCDSVGAETGDAVGAETCDVAGAIVGEGATPVGAVGATPVGAVGVTPVGTVGVLGALGFVFGLQVGFRTAWLDTGTKRRAKIKARRMVADWWSMMLDWTGKQKIMRVLPISWIVLLRRMLPPTQSCNGYF